MCRTFAIAAIMVAVALPTRAANDRQDDVEAADALVQRIYSEMPKHDSARFMRMCDTLYEYGVALDGEGHSYKRMSVGSRVGYLVNHDGFAEAKVQMERLRKLADKEDSRHELYITWYNFVLGYGNSRNPVAAIEEKQRMQEHALRHKDYEGVALSYMSAASLYVYNWELGLQNLEKALEYAKQSEQPTVLLNTYTSICLATRSLKRWDELLGYATTLKQLPHTNPFYTEFADLMALSAYVGLGRKSDADRLYSQYCQVCREGRFSGFNAEQWVEVAIDYLLEYGPLAEVPQYLAQMERKDDYYALSSIYFRKLGDTDRALLYADSLHERSMHSFVEYEKAQLASANAKLNNQALEFEKEELTLVYQHDILIAACGSLLLLVLWIAHLHVVLRKLKHAQRELVESNSEIQEQKKRVEESEKMKTAFIHTMSHEIRTPLNLINGYSALLAEDNAPREDREFFAQNVNDGIDRLTKIVDNMLELSQIITSASVPVMEDVDVCSLCRRLVQYTAQRCYKGLEITFSTDAEYTVRSSAVYLSKVITNLLDNAVKFTSEGSISLTVSASGLGSGVRITVTDTGIGIPPDKQEWVFDRFTKVDSFAPGVGIGLYLCRLILQRLGGSIHVDGTVTNGCRMVVHLP